MNSLTPAEERVIVHKGTERPFSGKYDDFFQEGTYICRRCNAPLYVSNAKFHSGCGWPSFDQEIEGAVKRIPDPDAERPVQPKALPQALRPVTDDQPCAYGPKSVVLVCVGKPEHRHDGVARELLGPPSERGQLARHHGV